MTLFVPDQRVVRDIKRDLRVLEDRKAVKRAEQRDLCRRLAVNMTEIADLEVQTDALLERLSAEKARRS